MDQTEILAPDDAPSWVQDRARLWNEVEAAETRKNSQVAREIIVALPKEIEAASQRQLVRGFVSEQCISRGMVADVAYHDVGSGNPHAHVLLTTRRIDPDGFAGKDRSWNDRGASTDQGSPPRAMPLSVGVAVAGGTLTDGTQRAEAKAAVFVLAGRCACGNERAACLRKKQAKPLPPVIDLIEDGPGHFRIYRRDLD